MSGRIVVLALLALSSAVLGAGERVSMRVSPAIAFEPANLTIRATVQAHQDNRAIEVIAESDNFYRSSEIQLDGDRAPRTTFVEFRSVPGGQYDVRVVLRGVSGRELASTQSHVNIVVSGGSLR